MQDYTKLTDAQLKDVAVAQGMNPKQPRFKLLQQLGVKKDIPQLPERVTLTSSKGRKIKEWNGRW